MDLDAYRVFTTLVKTGSFAKTADALHMSQSSISLRLQQLEQELGVALLLRGRGITLTPPGEAFLPGALAMVEADQRARFAVAKFVATVQGAVAIHASQTSGSYILPQILSSFSIDFPQVDVHLRIANSDLVVKAVVDGHADFGIVESPTTSAKLRQRTWVEDPLTLVCAVNHPLTARPNLTPAALQGCLLAVREPGSGTRATLVESWPGPLINTFRLLELGSLAAIRRTVLAGTAVAYISRWVVADDLASGRLVELSVAGIRPIRTMRLIRRREPFASRAASALYDVVATASPHQPTPEAEARPPDAAR
ncbi:MAG: LysR family transcriptional regulator [Sulfobacillus sp.]